MQDSELTDFHALMAGMAFLRGYSKLGEGAAAQYFRVLKGFDFGDVARAADYWAGHEQFFPAPAQWVEAVSKVPKGQPLLELSVDQAREYADAEGRGFEGQCCTCRECAQNGVDEKPTRYVPTEDRHGETEQRTYRGRAVVVGHWAHGLELFRWYAARANFYEQAMRLKLGYPGAAVLDVVGGPKVMP